MNTVTDEPVSPRHDAPWLRLHRALMPDYNAKATMYWWAMVALGTMVLWYASSRVADLPSNAVLQIVVGSVIAAAAGFFPVRIPRSTNSFAAGEIFIFLLLLLNGPEAATVAAAGEALIGSCRTSKRWTSRIASPAMAAVAMFSAGSVLHALLGLLRSLDVVNAAVLLVTSMLFAVAYFMLNTLMVTLVMRLKRNEPLVWREFLTSFGWVGIAYAGSASVAALLYLTFQQSGIGVLMAAVPIIAMLLTTLHFFFRHQAADEAARKSRVEAAEREAAQAARHVLELRESEKQLRESEQRFHSAFTHASIGMALVSFSGRVLQVNRALLTLLDRNEAELREKGFSEFIYPDDMPTLERWLARLHARAVDNFTDELRCRHRDGSVVWVALNCSLFSEVSVEQPRLILQVQDITARRNAEERLHHIAFHDSLTGLPNRARFHQHLARVIERARSEPEYRYAVMFIDFDRFKLINDSMGHNAGDEFLIQVSRRIRDCVRPGDAVARLGGDEFAILCDALDSERSAVQLADRLLAILRQPFQIGGTEVTTSASIGITFSGFGYETPEEVLRDADIAMYKAKNGGKARYALFDASLHAQVTDRMRIERDLRRALTTNQMSVAYQPLYAMKTGALIGFEALLRWEHPEHGPISPAMFIPIAEDAAMMVPLTDFVLETACRQLRRWQSLSSAFSDLRVHINISGHDIAHSGFGARVARALVETRLRPEHLTIELTENILMERLEGAMQTLEQMRELGVNLSVDDFGTGYSSLSYLSSLPIDSLKIDRSFVHALSNGSKETEVVRAIVSLGRALGKAVVAEGIETATQFDQLRNLGCDVGQGYYLSRPQTAKGIDALLERIEAESGDSARHSRFGRLSSVLTFRF